MWKQCVGASSIGLMWKQYVITGSIDANSIGMVWKQCVAIGSVGLMWK